MTRSHHALLQRASNGIVPPGRFAHRRDRYTFGDAMLQATTSLSSRPGRLAMTCTAVALGIGALVATIGFAQTGSGQLNATFDSYAATRIVVKPVDSTANPPAIPWDAEESATRLNGVAAAGSLTDVTQQVRTLTSLPLNDPEALPHAPLSVAAVSPGLLDTIGGHVQQGAFINSFHNNTRQRVAVLGSRAADVLSVSRMDIQQAVFINDQSYVVIGIVTGMMRHPELESAVLIPQETARDTLGLASTAELQIRINVGAGTTVGQQVAMALNPSNPSSLTISVPDSSSVLQKQLSGDINILFLTLGIMALGIAALTIAVTTSLSVMERKGEIGLRRALGATRMHIISLLLTECAVTGLIGGLFGAASGICVVVGVAITHNWTPIVDPSLIAAAGIGGILIGVTGGLIPAISASQLEPAVALQQGT